MFIFFEVVEINFDWIKINLCSYITIIYIFIILIYSTIIIKFKFITQFITRTYYQI